MLVADQHALFREALRAALGNESDLDLVGEAGDGLGAMAAVAGTRPDVALVEAWLPGCDPGRAASLFTQSRGSPPRVVIMADTGSVEEMIETLSVGASGYLTKDRPLKELIEAARSVHRGETLIPRPMLGPLLQELLRRRREEDQALRVVSLLTRREQEIFALFAADGDNESIAHQLMISPQTVRTHLQNIVTKLGVHSRQEAASLALRVVAPRRLVETHR